MKTVKREEIENFIRSQPDDRPVDMGHNRSTDYTGDVMVHYALENLNFENRFICGFNNWFDAVDHKVVGVIYDIKSIYDIVQDDGPEKSKTYGDLKKFLKD